MHYDDQTLNGFVKLIDRTIEIAKERIKHRDQGSPDVAPPGALENVVKALYFRREQAMSGQLEPSGGEVTLGFLRAVGDWAGEPPDSALVNAAADLEKYYLDEMK